MNSGVSMRPVEVLLVEDNPDDVDLTIEAFKDAKIQNGMHTVSDGVEAMIFLRDVQKPRPDLILLDLNMPRKHGREVLEVLKTDEDLKRIPVVVLTRFADTAARKTAVSRSIKMNRFLSANEISIVDR